jgi:segregation and condensation protein B
MSTSTPEEDGSGDPTKNDAETGAAPDPGEQAAIADDSGEAHRYLKGAVEALLFVAEAPLTPKELARAAKIDRKRTLELIEEIRADYAPRGIQLHEVAGGYCFRSNPEFANYVKTHLAQRPVRLSRAQLETLSIIAYRQPITRPEVDDIRGVDSGPVIKGLLERDLVKILGKKDEPGRPMLYGTTVEFLELFNMRSLQDLPTLKEFTELTDESRRRFEKSIGEDAPEGPIDAAALSGDAPGEVHGEGEAGDGKRGGDGGERDEENGEGEEDEDDGEDDEEEEDEGDDDEDEDDDEDDEDGDD